MIEDSVADDRVILLAVKRALAERGEAPLHEKLSRLHYVLDRMALRKGQDSVAMSHARTAGSVMLGLRNGDLRSRVTTVLRRGSVEAALSSLSEWLEREPWPVPEFDPAWLAQVYIVAAEDFPGVYKVGFSAHLEERMAKLRWQSGSRIRLVTTFGGTMFDEHLLQHDLRQFSMANEWFDLTGRWVDRDRHLPLYTVDRMWRELHALADVSAAHKSKIEVA